MECILADRQALQKQKQLFLEQRDRLLPLQQAAAACAALPVDPVTNKKHLPPGVAKNEYISLGTYWWPDPQREGGLPYLRRDGYVNPLGRDTAYYDRARLETMANAVFVLATAYVYTEDAAYRIAACRHLDAWFKDPETRMRPHLEFAQRIPGVCAGRDIGIIDTQFLVELIDSALLLQYDGMAALRAWAGQYLHWLQTSDHGLSEARQQNNHGLWYDLQVMALAAFTEDAALVRQTACTLQKRLAQQTAPDGSFPLELGRTRSYMYSLFALRAAVFGAAIAEKFGCGFWDLPLPCGTFQRCFDFILPYAKGEAVWPHQQLDPVPRQSAALCLRFAARAYQNTDYAHAARRVYENIEDTTGVLYRYPLEEDLFGVLRKSFA